MTRIVAGTRGSALARAQAGLVAQALRAGDAMVEERIIATEGDVNASEHLQGTLEVGWFSQALEAALMRGEIDIAVHSLKDLPTASPPELMLGAILPRAAPGDLLLARHDALDTERPFPLRKGARVGSSSIRRAQLLAHHAPHCAIVPHRGNVPTRVEKLRAGDVDAIVLAEAGVRRLHLPMDRLAVFRLDIHGWPPAPGQGAIAVQCRALDVALIERIQNLDDAATRAATKIERAFLSILQGGCSTPFGCFADEDQIVLGLAAAGSWRAAKIPRFDRMPMGLDGATMKEILTRLSEGPTAEVTDGRLVERV